MIKKRIIWLVLLVLFISVFCLDLSAATAKGEVNSIGFDDALGIALSQNRGLERLDSEISLARYRYDAEISARGTYIKDSKKKILDDLIYQKAQLEQDINTNTARLYFGILIQQKRISLQSEKISSMNDEYSTKKREVELGKYTESTLMDIEIRISEENAALTSMENTCKSMIMDLNNLMGYDIDRKLVLKDETIPSEDISISSMDYLVSDVLSQSYQIISIKRDIQLDNLKKSGAAPDLAQQIEDDILVKEYDLEDTEVALEKRVRSEYNEILNLNDTVTLNKLKYDSALKGLEEAKMRFKLGLISENTYSLSKQQADGALYTYMQSGLDYYVKVKSYKYLINNDAEL